MKNKLLFMMLALAFTLGACDENDFPSGIEMPAEGGTFMFSAWPDFYRICDDEGSAPINQICTELPPENPDEECCVSLECTREGSYKWVSVSMDEYHRFVVVVEPNTSGHSRKMTLLGSSTGPTFQDYTFYIKQKE